MSIHRACCCECPSITVTVSGTTTECTDCRVALGTISTGTGQNGRFKIKSFDMNGSYICQVASSDASDCIYLGTIPNGVTVEEYEYDGVGFETCETLLGECTRDVEIQVAVRKDDDGARSIIYVYLVFRILSDEWCYLVENTPDGTIEDIFSATIPTCAKAPSSCKRFGDSISNDLTSCTPGLNVGYGGTVVVT